MTTLIHFFVVVLKPMLLRPRLSLGHRSAPALRVLSRAVAPCAGKK